MVWQFPLFGRAQRVSATAVLACREVGADCRPPPCHVAWVSPGSRVRLFCRTLVATMSSVCHRPSRIPTVRVTCCMLGDQHWMRRPCCAGSRIGMRGNGPAQRILIAVWVAAWLHHVTSALRTST